MIQFAPEPRGREAFDAFLRSLLVADWESATGPMRFCPSLTLADLGEAVFFQNSRRFLAALDEAGETPATATGNLNRVFVRRMFDRLVLSQRSRESTLAVCKVLNEQDVWPLHIARIVSECARLVARRKQRFQVTRAGRELLPEAQAGTLYRKLFVAYFRKFDLHYDFHFRDVPGIQQTLAVILWRLDNVVCDWTPVRDLPEVVLLPGVHQQVRAAMVSEYDTEAWILGGYVLEPLLDLGLLERRPESEWQVLEKNDEVRLSPLWQKFIHFEHWAGGGR
jgi:hypothetical protein